MMTKLVSFSALLLFISSVAIVSASSLDQPEPFDDWKADHYVLYAKEKEATPLSPVKTLEILKKLQNLYRDREDQGSRGRFERVSNLIEASNVVASADKCNEDYLKRLDRLIKEHSMFIVNVIPYLKLHQQHQLDVCNNLVKSNLRKMCDKQDVTAKIIALSSKIDQASSVSKYYRKILANEVSAGIFDFIEAQGGDLEEKIKNSEGNDERGKISSLIKRTVEGACMPLGGEFGSIFETAAFMGHRFSVQERNIGSAFAKCNLILNNLDEVSRLAQSSINYLRSKNSPLPGLMIPEPHEDWMADHYVVYAKGKDDIPLNPAKTLELLKKLQNLYRDRQDQGSRGRFERVSRLIEASEISQDKCDKESLLLRSQLIKEHSMYQVNIIPYLELQEMRQLQLCHGRRG